MKKTVAFVLVIATCTAVYAKKHKNHRQEKNPDRIISVELRHEGCYGRCPVYKIAVNKDGMATYTGIRFTQDSGVFQKNIGRDKAQDILGDFNSFRIDTCRNLYKSRASDLPGAMFTVTYTDSTKVIRNANFGPLGVRGLVVLMDGIAPAKLDSSWHRAGVQGK